MQIHNFNQQCALLRNIGKHICSQNTEKKFHTCESRCPDCKALCIKPYGHEGKHSTQQHRNKDSQIYTQMIGVNIRANQREIGKFQFGNTAARENCTQYCERQGRSHFHIVECQGNDQCLEKLKAAGARHSTFKYFGYEQLDFDEVLCSSYWKLNNWEHPVLNDQKRNEINLCNHYCPICKVYKKQFCQRKAWHSQSILLNEHRFSCGAFHLGGYFSSIEICFVIDSTNSMQPYITKSIEVIKEIVQKAQQYKIKDKKYQIRFSVVAYKDHVNDTTANTLEFTDHTKCIEFLSQIKIEGNFDLPEAVLDGLNYGVKMNWSKNSYKTLYLIADAPPHGNKGERIYHNFEDYYPTGCPCGLKQTPLLQKMLEQDIKFKIIKLNDKIEMMITEFQKDYQYLEVYTVENQNEYKLKIVEDVTDILKNLDIAYDETQFQKNSI